MSWMKKNTLSVLLLAIVYLAFFIYHSLPQNTSTSQVLGAKTNLSLFEQPNDGRQPLLDAIDNSQKSIEMEMYELTDKQIIAALVDAEKRGVIVKVMLEQHPYLSGSVNASAKKALDAAHISNEWTNPVFALTHEKDVIVDDSEVFILNQNITVSSFSKNREFDIIDRNAVDVQEAEQIFAADWNRQSYTPPVSHLVLSPVNSRASLTTLLNSATKTIDIEMEIVEDKDIINLLENKAKTTEIHVIIPTLKKDPSNAEPAKELENAGVTVRAISSPYIHAKLILIDDTQAYIGSVNLSSSSMDENRELGIIFTQDDIIQHLTTDFATDWEKANNL